MKPRCWMLIQRRKVPSIWFITKDGIKSKFQLDVPFFTYILDVVVLFVCSWDEYVQEKRILKYNEQGLAKQKELRSANVGKRGRMMKKGGAGGPSSAAPSEAGEDMEDGPDSHIGGESTPSLPTKSKLFIY